MSSLSHAYESKYVDKKASAVRRTSGYFNTKSIVGRQSETKYGSYVKPKSGKKYASKYYDPVARHERYLEERASLGIGSGRSGGGSGGSKKGSSGGRGGKANIAKKIQKLREESSLNTEAQQEATRRKIEDLKRDLRKQVLKMQKARGDNESSINVSEIRGNIQRLRKQIEASGGNLKTWISKERDALELRIAAVYKAHGQKYTPRLQADNERASKKRNKEVNSRADAIYKSKYRKK